MNTGARAVFNLYKTTPVVCINGELMTAMQVYSNFTPAKICAHFEDAILFGLLSWQSVKNETYRVLREEKVAFEQLDMNISQQEFEFVVVAAKHFKGLSLYDVDTLRRWCDVQYPLCVAQNGDNPNNRSWYEDCVAWLQAAS